MDYTLWTYKKHSKIYAGNLIKWPLYESYLYFPKLYLKSQSIAPTFKELMKRNSTKIYLE